MVISSALVANILLIINLPMAMGNLPIAANGFPLVPISNNAQVASDLLHTACDSTLRQSNNSLLVGRSLLPFRSDAY